MSKQQTSEHSTSQAEVDLLHAVDADLVVSSVYRRQQQQAERLVDGDPTTAWNSATGELAGAWIEFRLPPTAQIARVEIIPGFARVNGTTDLFTGNHRVASLRVTRDGTDLGVFEVANVTPTWVPLPIAGPGGVYRLTVASTTPGTRTDWRELCISELRVIGTAPTTRAGERLPRLAVGAMPNTVPPPTREQFAAWLSRELRAFRAAWIAMYRILDGRRQDSAEPDSPADEQLEVETMRRSLLTRLGRALDGIDTVASDALRIRAMAPLGRAPIAASTTLAADLVQIRAGFLAGATYLQSRTHLCETAQNLAGAQLPSWATAFQRESMFEEQSDMEADMTGEGQLHSTGADRARTRTLRAFGAWLARFSRQPKPVAAEILAASTAAAWRSRTEWNSLRPDLEAVQSTCD